MSTEQTLGTLLRHLIEKLDGAVEGAYAGAGLDYKPRYTPVVRALCALEAATIRDISKHARISHSAVSQTVSQMVQVGLVEVETGIDARERIIRLSPAAKAMLPRLEAQWAATECAARTLDEELGFSLPEALQRAIRLLEQRSFAERIQDAVQQTNGETKA